MNEESKQIPMVIIILAIIFCWPAGIFLLYLKYIKGFKIEKKSKIAVLQRKQKNNQTIAIILLMLALIFASVIFSDTEETMLEKIGDVVLALSLYGLPAYIFFKRAKSKKK